MPTNRATSASRTISTVTQCLSVKSNAYIGPKGPRFKYRLRRGGLSPACCASPPRLLTARRRLRPSGATPFHIHEGNRKMAEVRSVTDEQDKATNGGDTAPQVSSEARSVGKEGGRTCRSRLSPYHE